LAAPVLLIAALALLFWPASWTTAAKRAPAAPEVVEAPAPNAVPMVVQEPASVAPVVAPPAFAPAAGAPAAPASAPSIVATAPVAASAAGIAVFTATGTSWLEVRDATGAVVLQRTLQAGETANASGGLPLSVIVGRADAMRVQVRGRELDVKALARENVARFEVR
jgi:cytoskeleton protein RodZ